VTSAVAGAAPFYMQHFILSVCEGAPEIAHAQLDAGSWPVASTERHRDALAPGDRALLGANRDRARSVSQFPKRASQIPKLTLACTIR